MYALILAGGKGERLRPYTQDRPKPMIEVSGKPLLEHQIDWLKKGGVTNVIILCGYMHNVIMDYFGDGKSRGIHISYSIEEEPLGRGGAFRKGFELVPNDQDLVVGTNGDNLNTQPIAQLIKEHREKNACVTVMLAPLVSPYGIATLDDDGWIVGFQEKPRLPHWLNAGVYVISKEAFPLFPEKGDHEDTTFPHLARKKRLRAFRSSSYWKAIDTVKDLTDASKEFKEVI